MGYLSILPCFEKNYNNKIPLKPLLAAKVQIAGVTLERDSISRIEIGTRFVTDYELKIFAKVLHVNVEWLLEETEE